MICMINVKSNTFDCDLSETIDITSGTGVQELHHFPRCVIKEGIIHSIISRIHSVEFKSYSDSVSTFVKWFTSYSLKNYNQFWFGENLILVKKRKELYLQRYGNGGKEVQLNIQCHSSLIFGNKPSFLLILK